MRGIVTGIVSSLVVVGWALSIAAQAPAPARAAAANPIIGTWKFSAQKSKLSNTLPPKDLIRKYEDRGEGVYIYTQAGHGPDGHRMFSMYVGRDDGKEYPLVIEGADDFGSITLKKVDALTSEQSEKAVQGGRVTATGTRKVSADGKTLTITIRARALGGGNDDAAGAVAATASAAPAAGGQTANNGRTGAFAPEAVIQLDPDVFVFERVS